MNDRDFHQHHHQQLLQQEEQRQNQMFIDRNHHDYHQIIHGNNNCGSNNVFCNHRSSFMLSAPPPLPPSSSALLNSSLMPSLSSSHDTDFTSLSSPQKNCRVITYAAGNTSGNDLFMNHHHNRHNSLAKQLYFNQTLATSSLPSTVPPPLPQQLTQQLSSYNAVAVIPRTLPTTVATTDGLYTNSNSMFVRSDLFQPSYYYDCLSQSFNDFNVLQMCFTNQHLLNEFGSVANSPSSSDLSPRTDSSLYGFANRLHPLTTNSLVNTSPSVEQYLPMPHSYQQGRNVNSHNNTSNRLSVAKRGGRRPKEFEEYDQVTLSEEERDKRDKRRLRNKEAAARCRQRRLDLMGSLQSQVEHLKEENKLKESKIAELTIVKNELLKVIREHRCLLPESLRQTLEGDLSSTHQYMSHDNTCSNNDSTCNSEYNIASSTTTTTARIKQTIIDHKRPVSEIIPELCRQQQPSQQQQQISILNINNHNNANKVMHVKQEFKAEPTLYEMNRNEMVKEEMKRPTTLSFTDMNNSSSYSNISSSAISITTPSSLIVCPVGSDFVGVNLLDGPTGLTPCQQQPTAYQVTSLNTPLDEGRSFENL